MIRADRLRRALWRVFGQAPESSFEVAGCAHDTKSRSRLLEVDKWSVSKTVLNLVSVVGVHPYPLDELLLMVAAFSYHRPEITIDIGTHIGKSARIWLELARLCQVPTAIHTIDLLDPDHPEYPGTEVGRLIRGTSVLQHFGDGYSTALELIRENPNARFLIFLDSDHSYENVRRELELAKHVKDGCLLVHDTFYQPSSTYNHGPYLAVCDYIDGMSIRQVIHLNAGLPGMSYIAVNRQPIEEI